MKIPSEKKQGTYELTCLIPAEYTKSELEDLQAKIEELIVKNDGEVEEIEDWGKKDLAYTIKKEGKNYDEAVYLHFIFESETKSVDQIKKAINLVEEIIRYLIVKQDN